MCVCDVCVWWVCCVYVCGMWCGDEMWVCVCVCMWYGDKGYVYMWYVGGVMCAYCVGWGVCVFVVSVYLYVVCDMGDEGCVCVCEMRVWYVCPIQFSHHPVDHLFPLGRGRLSWCARQIPREVRANLSVLCREYLFSQGWSHGCTLGGSKGRLSPRAHTAPSKRCWLLLTFYCLAEDQCPQSQHCSRAEPWGATLGCRPLEGWTWDRGQSPRMPVYLLAREHSWLKTHSQHRVWRVPLCSTEETWMLLYLPLFHH